MLLARWVVRAASLLLSPEDRTAFRAEWESELWHEAQGTDGPPASPFRLFLWALGAPRDAVAVRRSRLRLDGPGVLRGRGGSADRERKGMAESVRALVSGIRVAARGLMRSPGFTGTAVLVLALGLGANSALFTVVNAVLLRPLAFPESDRLVRVTHPVPGLGANDEWGLSMAGFYFLLDNNRTLDGLAVYGLGSANLSGGESSPERVRTVSVSASIFGVLRAVPLYGRPILEEDNSVGAATVAVLGHGFWRRRFGGDPAVVGTTIRLDGRPVEVVGIAPAGLEPPERPVDIWLPLWLDRELEAQNSHYLNAVGRLGEGADLAAAQADLNGLTSRFTEAMPTAYSPDFMTESRFSTRVVSLRAALVGGSAASLWVVFGAVLVVLLIACVNVANLFLVRTEARRLEVAVRTALGATRGALARVFFTESFVLVGVAAVLGVALSVAGVRVLLAVGPNVLPRANEIAPGAMSVGFAIALALCIGLVLGALPLLRYGRGLSARALRDGTGRVAVARTSQRARTALVALQIAAALVLLTGAALLGRSVQRMLAVDHGFDAEGAFVFDVVLPQGKYDTVERWNAFYGGLLRDLESIAGVTAAGATTDLPLASGRGCWAIMLPQPIQTNEPLCHPVAFVTPGYFAAAGIPILEGRETTWSDNEARNGALVISHALARTLWGGASALDREIKIFDGNPPFFRVVGVASDVRAYSLTEPYTPLAYFPIVPNEAGAGWVPPGRMNIVVRSTRADPLSLLPEARAALARADPEIPLSNANLASELVARSVARHDFVLLLLAVAAGMALLLGAIGLYGVVAYLVGQRRNEIGIRLALGARASEVRVLVLRESARIALIGLLLGLAGTFALTRVLGSLLFEVSPLDPMTIMGVSVLLLVVLVAASWVPAHRATRVDPAEMLRVG